MATVLAEPNYHSLLSDHGLWMSPPSPDPTSYINLPPHLSPISTPYQGCGSSDNLTIDVMGTPPPHQSPHHCFSDTSDGCSGLMYTTEFNSGCEMIPQYTPGERSPDSGIYSPPCHSPPTSEFDPLTMAEPLPTCSQLNMSTSNYLSNGILHYSIANHPQPGTLMFGPYSQTSNMTCDVPCQPMFARNHPFVDSPMNPNAPIPITLLDQTSSAHANPIQYYADDFSSFLDSNGSPPCYPSQFTEDFAQPQHPIKPHKRIRKVKPPASVDPSEIKDIPASAQLWEFLLKVLKKPKYAYMVSWENQQDGLFRFHDPPAFAALWGRHRNRPSMTYDKVARALRYYYRRDILEQVGGRLTYKFSSRLCKQFASSIGAVGKTNITSSDKKKN